MLSIGVTGPMSIAEPPLRLRSRRGRDSLGPDGGTGGVAAGAGGRAWQWREVMAAVPLPSIAETSPPAPELTGTGGDPGDERAPSPGSPPTRHCRGLLRLQGGRGLPVPRAAVVGPGAFG